jgi:trimeric autotransporter adhesin
MWLFCCTPFVGVTGVSNHLNKIKITTVLIVMLIINLNISLAQNVPTTFTYQGRLYSADGLTPLVATVDFKLQILDPTATCLLYEEVNENLSLTDGLFSISIGSPLGSSKRTLVDPGMSMASIFSNDAGTIRTVGSPNCSAGYSPNQGDKRKLKVTVYNRSTSQSSQLSPLQELSMSPYSLISDQSADAKKLGGKGAAEFIQTSTAVTQSAVENWFSSSVLPQLLAGTYLPSSLAPIAASGSASDLSTGTVPMARIGNSGTRDSSTFLRGDGTWATPAGGGGGSVNSVTATVGTPITIGGTGSAPTVGISVADTSTNGYLTSTDWNTFNNKQAANAELSALGGITGTGILQRTGSASYTSLGTLAPLSVSAGNIGITQSNTSTDGYLSSSDWNTFNNKASGGANSTITSLSSTTSITSTGSLTMNAGGTNQNVTLNPTGTGAAELTPL